MSRMNWNKQKPIVSVSFLSGQKCDTSLSRWIGKNSCTVYEKFPKADATDCYGLSYWMICQLAEHAISFGDKSDFGYQGNKLIQVSMFKMGAQRVPTSIQQLHYCKREDLWTSPETAYREKTSFCRHFDDCEQTPNLDAFAHCIIALLVEMSTRNPTDSRSIGLLVWTKITPNQTTQLNATGRPWQL